ncbi:AlpA family phage regulatory protein [Mesorhizobium sp. NZP2234]|nr:AlpA family phage regulatory protein [Mesorhizobium sp. NZP2234]
MALQPNNDNGAPRLISIKAVSQLTSMSRTLVKALIADGQFPLPVRLGERRFAFVRAEVQAWIDRRIAARAAA